MSPDRNDNVSWFYLNCIWSLFMLAGNILDTKSLVSWGQWAVQEVIFAEQKKIRLRMEKHANQRKGKKHQGKIDKGTNKKHFPLNNTLVLNEFVMRILVCSLIWYPSFLSFLCLSLSQCLSSSQSRLCRSESLTHASQILTKLIMKEYERAVIFRLGRLLTGGARGPGVFFVIPCVDSYQKIDMRTKTYEIPPQEVTMDLIKSRSRKLFFRSWPRTVWRCL